MIELAHVPFQKTSSNVDDVISAYYDIVPDPTDVGQRVAFGTSGHRGSSLDGKFNEAHIIAITAAIIEYRASQGINGPLFIGRDTHALSEPAWRTALEVLAAAGIDTRIDSRAPTRRPPPCPSQFWARTAHRRTCARRVTAWLTASS